MGMYSLKNLGALESTSTALGIGSGSEPPIFWLTNHVKYVVATDRYTLSTWNEANPTMLTHPERLSTIQFKPQRLSVMIMDGSHLCFDGETFEIIFSYCAIEHFGGGDRSHVKKAMREMERVLRPGGALSLTTEICVDGVEELLRLREEGKPFAADIFTPKELDECILRSTSLHLEGDLDISISERDRKVATKYPDEIDKLPHVLLDYDGALFTSVHLLFTKT